ncbi:MAG: hypothetical protein Phog2KO_06610 [Phototrophicaceae bacterium]
MTAQDDFPEDMLEDGAIEITDFDLALEVEFDDEDDWEFYEDDVRSAQVDEDDEVYVIEVESDDSSTFLWGQDTTVFTDVVIQVDTEQLSNEDDNGYGIMCRTDEDATTGNGYIFYIKGDGFVSIFLNNGEDSGFLSEWEESDAVNQGEDENTLTVVCVGEYLGFYVNGELVAEAEDDTFDEGVVALAASIFAEDEDAEIIFDNLFVWEVEGESGGRSDTNNSSSDVDIDDLEDDITDMLEDGDVEIELEDVILIETWDEEGEWDIVDGDGFTIELDDDRYFLEEEAQNLVWGVNRTEHEDVVMHVEIERESDGEASFYGMMCRVDPDDLNNGYSFIFSADGRYSIGYWDGGYTSLVGDVFEDTNDIDEDDSYVMTIVCVDEYLALYVDGELIDEVEDDTYDEGYAGLAGVSRDDDGLEVAFDNLVIWEASD